MLLIGYGQTIFELKCYWIGVFFRNCDDKVVTPPLMILSQCIFKNYTMTPYRHILLHLP